MGCDIHYVLERETPAGWLGVYTSDYRPYIGSQSTPLVKQRNYNFFAEIANVRGKSSLGAERTPKGVPEDASALTRHCLMTWGDDGHSTSYLSGREFCESWIATKEEEIAYFSKKGETAEDYVKSQRELLENVKKSPSYRLLGYDDDPQIEAAEFRVVFWFDN